MESDTTGARLARVPRAGWVLVAVAAVLTLVFTRADIHADTARSRLATVFSLVEHGTFFLDTPDGGETDNPFARTTVDRVMVRGERVDGAVRGGRMISSKPPLLPLLMTAEYLMLKPLGLDLRNEDDAAVLLRIMTVTFAGIPFIASLALFLLAARRLATRSHTPVLLVALLALGTQYAAFSLTLNNHVPAAAAVIASLALALRTRDSSQPRPVSFLLAGALMSLVFALDMPATVFPALMCAWMTLRHGPRAAVWITAGAAPVLLLHFGVMTAVTGSPLPVQVRPEVYLYPDSAWRHPMGVDAFNMSAGAYLFHMTLGWKGVFTLYPVLLLGAAGFALATMGGAGRLRLALLAGGFAVALMIAYYTLKTNNFGGDTYGMRWLIAAMPVLLLMAVPVADRLRGMAAWSCVVILLAVSTYSAFHCARTPWAAGKEWTTRVPLLAPVPTDRPESE